MNESTQTAHSENEQQSASDNPHPTTKKFSPQSLTCFPNQNHKHIDYVIAYKYNESEKNHKEFIRKEIVRRIFFDRLREETLELEFLAFKEDKKIQVYILIHCPMERLFIEAEKLKHQCRLNSVSMKNLFLSFSFLFLVLNFLTLLY